MAKNFFRKKSKDTTGNDWKATGSFIRKPTKGWLHADRLLETSGVTYETKVYKDLSEMQILVILGL